MHLSTQNSGWWLPVAAKKCAIMAGRMAPARWLRYGGAVAAQ